MTAKFQIDEEIIKTIRARQIARAFLDRGREAEIPEKYLRIGESDFRQLLCPQFHGKDLSGFVSSIYNSPDVLRKRDFIVIDGANTETRKKAGCALLFRMISYDLRGLYFDFKSLFHKFQSVSATDEMSRNTLAEEFKKYDVLFLGEYDIVKCLPHFESANFLDEVLGARTDKARPTIISFANPIQETKKSMEQLAAEGALNVNGGRYMAELAFSYKTTDTVLRIRVKMQ